MRGKTSRRSRRTLPPTVVWNGAWIGMIALLLLAGAPAARAESDYRTRGGAYVVTSSSYQQAGERTPQVEHLPLSRRGREHVYVVRRQVVAPSAVVSKRLSKQPVHEHLIELVVVNTPITLDPYQDLTRPTGGIDEDHYLREAQRIWRSQQAKPARVIRNPRLKPDKQSQRHEITPRAVIELPDHLDRPSPNDEYQSIPSVPTPPSEERHRHPSLVQTE